MDCKTLKGQPLTKEESKILLDLIEGSKVVSTKTTNAYNNKMKKEEWIRITECFNATVRNCPRTPQQLRLKWENMKKSSRIRSNKIRMIQIKTRGDPSEYIPPDDVLDRVAEMLGKNATGLTVQFGGDRETVGVNSDDTDNDGASNGDVNEDAAAALMSLSNEPVVCEVDNVLHDDDQIPNTTKRFSLSTPRAVRRNKPDESRTARNFAIAEYFAAKKQCLDAKLSNINLENETLKLKNMELQLRNKKLMLETEKLKLDLEKLKKQ